MDDFRRQMTALAYELALARVRAGRDPRELCLFTAQCFSQGPEDGVIAEIFRRIGTGSQRFIELGAGDGRENTTRLLLTLGWSGVWIEGNPESCAAIRRDFAAPLRTGQLKLIEAMVTAENADALLAEAGAARDCDFLSVDLDMNTHHIWKALTAIRPRAACIEYNASIPPSWDFTVPYDPESAWDGSTWYGAGLKSLEMLGAEKQMRLVGCDFYGVNAFFVSEAEDLSAFIEPFTAEKHYQPPTYLAPFRQGHWPARPRPDGDYEA